MKRSIIPRQHLNPIYIRTSSILRRRQKFKLYTRSSILPKSMSLTKFVKKIASIIYDTKQLQLDIILIMNHIFIIYLFGVILDVNNVF